MRRLAYHDDCWLITIIIAITVDELQAHVNELFSQSNIQALAVGNMHKDVSKYSAREVHPFTHYIGGNTSRRECRKPSSHSKASGTGV